MTVYTMGPWVAKESDQFGMTYKIMGQTHFGQTVLIAETVTQNDVYLITAAPEMLEVLKTLAIKPKDGLHPDDLKLIFGVIAKAEGKL